MWTEGARDFDDIRVLGKPLEMSRQKLFTHREPVWRILENHREQHSWSFLTSS